MRRRRLARLCLGTRPCSCRLRRVRSPRCRTVVARGSGFRTIRFFAGENYATRNFLPQRARFGRARRRCRGANADQVRARLALGGPCGAVHGRPRQRLLQGRGARRDDRHRQRLGGGHQPRRERRLPDVLRRHQFVDPLPRQARERAREGRDDGLRRAGLRDHHAEEERHLQAQGPGGQGARRARARRRLRPVAVVRRGEQDRRFEGEDREHRLPGARAHAGAGQGGRDHGILVLLLHQSEGERRAARRHRGAAHERLRARSLRQRDHGQPGLREGESQRGARIPPRVREGRPGHRARSGVGGEGRDQAKPDPRTRPPSSSGSRCRSRRTT